MRSQLEAGAQLQKSDSQAKAVSRQRRRRPSLEGSYARVPRASRAALFVVGWRSVVRWSRPIPIE